MPKYKHNTVVEYNDRTTITVHTREKKLMEKLDGFCEQSTEIKVIDINYAEPKKKEDSEEQPEEKTVKGKSYTMPRKWNTFRMPRQYTEEERAAMSERLKKGLEKANAAKSAKKSTGKAESKIKTAIGKTNG